MTPDPAAITVDDMGGDTSKLNAAELMEIINFE